MGGKYHQQLLMVTIGKIYISHVLSYFTITCTSIYSTNILKSCNSMNSIRVFTYTQNLQYWHNCKVCIPTNLQFSSFFALYDTSKYKIRYQCVKRITFKDYKLHCSCSFLMAQLKQSWQYWYSRIVESL